MTQVFIVAAGRRIGEGDDANQPGAVIPIGAASVPVGSAGGYSQLSARRANEMATLGWGAIQDDTGQVSASPAPASTLVTRGGAQSVASPGPTTISRLVIGETRTPIIIPSRTEA